MHLWTVQGQGGTKPTRENSDGDSHRTAMKTKKPGYISFWKVRKRAFLFSNVPEGRGFESHRLRKWKHRWYLIPTGWMSMVFFLLIPHLSGFWGTFYFDIWALFQKTPKTDTKRYITSLFEPLGSNITHISYPIIQSKVKVLRLHSSTFSFRSLLISAESPLRSTSR